MRKLISFLSISLDGYYADKQNGLDWAHSHNDAEFNEFVAGNAQGDSELIMGRLTYDMMVQWWPTPQAKKAMPEVADGMNRMAKTVFSRRLKNPTWENAHVAEGDLPGAVGALKGKTGPDMAILGSGSIVKQIAEAGLLDELHLVVVPVALGAGKRLFDGLGCELRWKLTRSRIFGNGSAFLCYAPAG